MEESKNSFSTQRKFRKRAGFFPAKSFVSRIAFVSFTHRSIPEKQFTVDNQFFQISKFSRYNTYETLHQSIISSFTLPFVYLGSALQLFQQFPIVSRSAHSNGRTETIALILLGACIEYVKLRHCKNIVGKHSEAAFGYNDVASCTTR